MLRADWRNIRRPLQEPTSLAETNVIRASAPSPGFGDSNGFLFANASHCSAGKAVASCFRAMLTNFVLEKVRNPPLAHQSIVLHFLVAPRVLPFLVARTNILFLVVPSFLLFLCAEANIFGPPLPILSLLSAVVKDCGQHGPATSALDGHKPDVPDSSGCGRHEGSGLRHPHYRGNLTMKGTTAGPC